MVMPRIKDTATSAGAGAEPPEAASPELLARPRRRTFTAKDKLRILARLTAPPACLAPSEL